jgi:hypothetical protein
MSKTTTPFNANNQAAHKAKYKKGFNVEISLLLKLFESIGFPAVIFVIWYIYHNAQVKTFEKIIANNFEILKDLVETNQYNATVLSRIESKIDGNLWCPVLKREIKQ